MDASKLYLVRDLFEQTVRSEGHRGNQIVFSHGIEDELGYPDLGTIMRFATRFVLTVGASANQNGTALFEGVTVIFLAQVFGIDLSFGQQVLVVLMSVLAGVGTAGVPGGSLPLIVVLMVQVGIPAEGIGLILGVDRFLDMCRTTLNVAGDLVIARLITSSVEQKDIDSIQDEAEQAA